MSGYRELLSTSTSVLLVDWPDRDVPDTFARHGFRVIAQEGPGDGRHVAYLMANGQVQPRPLEAAPDHIDIVYSHRPVQELAGIIELARRLNARAVWLQTGSPQAKMMVESAELEYVDSPYIADAVREVVEL